MPNWCSSTLTITGSKSKLKEFREFSKTDANRHSLKEDNDLDTERFMPYPKKYLDKDLKPTTTRIKNVFGQFQMVEDKDGYNNGGYEWCCRNWGTKWGICHAELRVKETENRKKFDDNEENKGKPQLVYTFDTAWSPGEPIVYKMSKMFPTLHFKWFCEEESRAFVCETEIENGKTVCHEDFDPEQFYKDEEDN